MHGSGKNLASVRCHEWKYHFDVCVYEVKQCYDNKVCKIAVPQQVLSKAYFSMVVRVNGLRSNDQSSSFTLPKMSFVFHLLC